MNKTLFLNQNSVKSTEMKTQLQINSILIGCIILFSIPSFLAFAQSEGEIIFILKRANQFFDAERYDESISIYDEVLEIDPNNVIALGKKGEAYAKLGNFDDTLFHFDQVLELNPTQPDSSGHPYFDLALEIDPNHINALLKKADPKFIEVKGYVFVGASRQRLCIDNMPRHPEIREFADQIAKECGYKFIDEQEASRVVLLMKEDTEDRIMKWDWETAENAIEMKKEPAIPIQEQ